MTRHRVVALLAVAAIAGLAAPAAAQSGQAGQIRFEHLSVEQGLSQSLIRAILQDRTGFLWFATHDGLNQYDGYRITTYRHEPDNPNSLPNSLVTALAEQRRPGGDRIWIGTNRGLAEFDAGQNRFTTHLAAESVPALHVDRSGVLWVGTARGLRRFDGTSFIRVVDDAPDGPNVSADLINGFADAADGSVWVATQRGLVRIGADGGVLSRVLAGRFVRGVLRDRRGRVWAATDAAGIARIDPASGRVEYYRAGASGLTGNSVNALLEDADGDLWAAVWGGGLNRIVEGDDGAVRFVAYRHDPADPTTLQVNDLNVLAQDRSGVIWVGTYGAGLSRFKPRALKQFVHYRRAGVPGGLTDNRVFALLVDRAGTLWSGTWLGVDRFAPRGPGPAGFARVESRVRLSDVRITSMAEGTDGAIWIGTLDGGVNRVDPATLRTTMVLGRRTGMTSDRIMSMAVSRAGTVWAGTLDGGLNGIDPVSGRVILTAREGGSAAALTSGRIDALFEDSRGTLWIGTFEGLHAIAAGSTAIRRISESPVAAGLLSVQITAIHEAPAGTLWIGTGGNGLVRVQLGADGTPVSARAIRRRDGLPNERIYAVRHDAQGRIWLSTDAGVARLDGETLRAVTFGTEDGLQAKEFREGAYFDARTGLMFLGGTNGFNVFDPPSVETSLTPPPVILTALTILNQPVPIGGSPLSTRITDTRTITLGPDDSVFSLEFAAIDYTAPERVRYGYMLEGFDRDWNQTDASRRFATYTNLSPGEYTFLVRAANREGEWSEEPLQLAVVILPPFWMTWWFRALIIAAAAVAIVTVHRVRLRGLEAQRARLEREVVIRTRELEEEKERALAAQAMAERANAAKSAFLASVSHELRTPLNAIVGLADVLVDGETAPRQREYMGALRSSGQALSELINDILDLSKIEAGHFELAPAPFDLRQVMSEAVDLVRLAADRKGLQLTATVAHDLAERVTGDVRALRRVLFNLVSNAVKFTPAGSVSLEVTPQADGVVLFVVTDTGIGIAPEHQGRVFGTFTQADAAIAREYGGTGLGLALSQQLVTLMGGRIWLDSAPGVGSTFAFTVPLHAAAAPPPRGIVPEALPRLCVLAADDAAQNRMVLEAYFHGSAHQLHTAESGEAALAMFRAGRYDLVLMDVNMPGMDGHATVRAMRALEAAERSPRTPILAVTAHAFAEDVERSRAAGCDGHLPKPLRKAVLLDALARYGGASLRPAGATVEPGLSAVRTPLVRVASELMAYLPEYLASTRAQLADAVAALDRGDRQPLRILGHNLKGSGGSFGLHEISRLGSRLEDDAACGADGPLRDRAIALGEYLAGVQVVPEET